jgi:ring-1,2-phenylacetyl-CoA epoxidase subunit PaaA
MSERMKSMSAQEEPSFTGTVNDADEARRMGEEYLGAVSKIVASHTVNELYGAQVFDEPAIALAPAPYEKWLTCRIAMEEYGHHVHFGRLAEALGVAREKLDPRSRHLSIFEFKMEDWPDFLAVKALADLAEIIQMEDLLECSYLPLRSLARQLMPEEKFHAGFGRKGLQELAATPAGKAAAERAVDRLFPVVLPFFGQSVSRNNELFRKWGVKQRTNAVMRGDFIARVRALCDALEIAMPPVPEPYPADLHAFEAATSSGQSPLSGERAS